MKASPHPQNSRTGWLGAPEQELDPTNLGADLALAAYTQAVALYDSCVQHATPARRTRDANSSTSAREEVSDVVRRW